MRSSSKTAAGALLGALLVALTGCVTGAPVVPEPEVTAPVTMEPTARPGQSPEATPSAAPAPTVGQIVTAEQAEALPQGLAAFPLPDGTRVVVAADQPLPAPVLAVAQAEMNARIADPGTPEEGDPGARVRIVEAAQNYASLLSIQTGGRNIVILYPLVGGCPWDEEAYLGWSYTTVRGAGHGECLVLPTLEDARAAVDGLIATTGTPEMYEVLILQR